MPLFCQTIIPQFGWYDSALFQTEREVGLPHFPCMGWTRVSPYSLPDKERERKHSFFHLCVIHYAARRIPPSQTTKAPSSPFLGRRRQSSGTYGLPFKFDIVLHYKSFFCTLLLIYGGSIVFHCFLIRHWRIRFFFAPVNTREEEEEEGSLTGELGEGVWKGGGGGKGRPIGRSCWSPPSSSFGKGGGERSGELESDL